MDKNGINYNLSDIVCYLGTKDKMTLNGSEQDFTPTRFGVNDNKTGPSVLYAKSDTSETQETETSNSPSSVAEGKRKAEDVYEGERAESPATKRRLQEQFFLSGKVRPDLGPATLSSDGESETTRGSTPDVEPLRTDGPNPSAKPRHYQGLNGKWYVEHDGRTFGPYSKNPKPLKEFTVNEKL